MKNKSSKSGTKNCKGASAFTLIECIVVLIVLGLVGVGILTYFFNARGTGDIRLRALGVQLAQDLMEEISSKKWDENRTQGPVSDALKTLPAALGPEAGESRYNNGATAFDDMDDYNGLSETQIRDSQGTILTAFPGFTRTAQVFYVNPSDLDTSVVTVPPPNYKRVRVVVSWNGGADSTDDVGVFTNR